MGIFDWKHWLIILIVVVLVFGTKRLKTLGSDIGEAIKGFRKAVNTEEGENRPAEPQTGTSAGDTLNKTQTIEGQAQKVDTPVRKD
ncbi:twin arginine translocase protein A [Azotobacter vinelandii CA]|uniref:Sec-independent protein translocase protein TatA n=2 Tax=Azotobacter vinelandii TaxID=354 RepID=TATA_AZOVD|nr:twin-arginine translocase TatA/TatE family subunit [Azotobacter vinelandii]C1DHS7.1 RecName: Full=Sec-independent protein translocase protein TatA [Azotobacter vinelandii DJ]ACO80660.1 Twin-arginine translocation protein [Azotobacter vinelandii DJ]AGK13132.1 twin arginine translocase protein A [Azotobacter vinelandii CA]AGK18840.1 twin arginine translocase protein A [Azotobacter vinelandii CA6]WKN21413.1 twin-arginine translocase TatA/TatE family subunit [Azotobacter vinelandii]SFY04033.1 